jgi:hypothetical protein
MDNVWEVGMEFWIDHREDSQSGWYRVVSIGDDGIPLCESIER